jgi:hypothetical protein
MKLKRQAGYQSFRTGLVSELHARGVKASPQAIHAMVHAIRRSESQALGDTDSILVGLLCAGSYTIDILLNAGVDLRTLRGAALISVKNSVRTDFFDVDPIKEFLTGLDSNFSLIRRKAGDGELLETADFLRAASSVHLQGPGGTGFRFPIKLRRDSPSKNPFQQQLEGCVCDMILDVVQRLNLKRYKRILAERTHPVTEKEDYFLDVSLGRDKKGMRVDELEFCIAALNAWFVHKSVLIEPEELCLRTTLWWDDDLPFGARLIMESEGDIRSIDVGLKQAARLSPERDLGGLVLINQDGRIHAGQYTYRHSLFVDSQSSTGFPIRPVSIQAIRPVSLISHEVLEYFEILLSKTNVHELEIQKFLVQNPGILESLGYAQAYPHVCLTSDSSDDLVPDFLLELPGQQAINILDLKLPGAALVARSPYARMASELVKAVAQLRKYASFFETPENRNEFHRAFGLTAFRPQLAVVMGRSSQFASPMERAEIEEQLGQVRLFTYDDLIAYGKSRAIRLP